MSETYGVNTDNPVSGDFPDGTGDTPMIPGLIIILLLAVAYGGTGWLGLSWAIETGYATAIWPPSGIALAAVLLFGNRVWPGIFLGSFCANILSVNSLELLANVSLGSFLVAIGIAVGATLQALAGRYLVYRFGEYPNRLISFDKIIRFFVFAGPLSCIVSAMIGVTVLVLSGIIGAGDWFATTLTWWGGDTLGVLIFTPLILVWRLDHEKAGYKRRAIVSGILLSTFALTIVSYGYVRSIDKSNVMFELEQSAADMAKELNLTLKGHINILHVQEGVFHAVQDVTPEQFQIFSNSTLTDFPALQAVSWNPRITDIQRARTENRFETYYGEGAGIKERDDQGNLISALPRDEYVPVLMIEPLEANRKALGFNVLSNPVRREALDLARDTGEPVTTGKITLVQEGASQAGVLVFRPHYRKNSVLDTVDDRQQALLGYHTGVFRVGDIIKTLFPNMETSGFHLSLFDRSAKSEEASILYSSLLDDTGVKNEQTAQSWTYAVNMPGRNWEVNLRILDSYFKERLQKSGWEILIPGLLITSLIGFLALLGTGRHLELETNVEERTKELRGEIAERKIAEKALIAARKEAESANLAKSEFLATMSHEIRTPMTGVIGFADMLLEDRLKPESLDKVERIKDCTNSLLRVINDILDISKLDAGKLEIERVDFSLPELIRDVFSLFNRGKREGDELKLELRLSDDFPNEVNSDPTRIRQILLNLIGNAFKFTHKGTLTVVGERYQSATGQEMFKISVIDTGIGIREDVLPELFSEFKQADASISRKYEGTGLGLVICKRLAKLMGGEIGVESTFGQGSTFWFTLPNIAATSSVRTDQIKKNTDDFETVRSLHLLIVEDNRINQRIIEFTIEALGHTSELAVNGLEALDAVKENDFDLILMDVRMPEMSGPDATREIRKFDTEKSAIPIVALTADAMKEHQEEYRDAGMDACVAKPINRGELVEAINHVMGEEIHRPAEEKKVLKA
ncbi:CHASE domain-containing protein [Kiloniella majae]|uniref:CHASE domain-containing protein n=1 Tax=Kiloniella majae TaxID=1938558 RepID=UPI000A2776D2|nr:CHASE domain-containing protein [Kiloniella majae]